MMAGMTWTKTNRSALVLKFSIAHRTARRLPFPPSTTELPLTAMATEFLWFRSPVTDMLILEVRLVYIFKSPPTFLYLQGKRR